MRPTDYDWFPEWQCFTYPHVFTNQATYFFYSFDWFFKMDHLYLFTKRWLFTSVKYDLLHAGSARWQNTYSTQRGTLPIRPHVKRNVCLSVCVCINSMLIWMQTFFCRQWRWRREDERDRGRESSSRQQMEKGTVYIHYSYCMSCEWNKFHIPAKWS